LWRGAGADSVVAGACDAGTGRTVAGAVVAGAVVAEVGSPSIICTNFAQATSSESTVVQWYGLFVTFLTKAASAVGSEVQSARTEPSAPTEALARAQAQAAAAAFLAAAVE
jgi:hypothetical protein